MSGGRKCRKCGQRTGPNRRLCKVCSVEKRHDFETADEIDDDPDELEYRCVRCGHEQAGTLSDDCEECGERRWRYVGPIGDGGAVATDGGSSIDDQLERIQGTWSDDDPLVLVFDDLEAGIPVVADVDGDLRYLSSKLVFPRETTEAEVRESIDEHGAARVEQLSAFEDRFGKPQFERDASKLVADGGTDRHVDDTVELRIRADRINLAGIMSTYAIGVAKAPAFGTGDRILEDVLEGMESVYPVQARTEDLRRWSDDHGVTADVDVELVELEDEPVVDEDDEPSDGTKIAITDGGEDVELTPGEEAMWCLDCEDWLPCACDGLPSEMERRTFEPDVATDGGVDVPARDDAYLSDDGPHLCEPCGIPFASIGGLRNHVCIPTDGERRGPMPASTVFRGPADPPETWTDPVGDGGRSR